jgi:hypothetical protein
LVTIKRMSVPLGRRFDAGDDALDAAPALGGIVELHEAAQLAAARRQLEPFCRAFLQRHDVPAKSRIGGQAKEPIDGACPALVEHFRSRIMTVGAQQDLDLGPMGRMAPTRRHPKPRTSTPLGRLPGRSTAVTERPSLLKTTIGWKP